MTFDEVLAKLDWEDLELFFWRVNGLKNSDIAFKLGITEEALYPRQKKALFTKLGAPGKDAKEGFAWFEETFGRELYEREERKREEKLTALHERWAKAGIPKEEKPQEKAPVAPPSEPEGPPKGTEVIDITPPPPNRFPIGIVGAVGILLCLCVAIAGYVLASRGIPALPQPTSPIVRLPTTAPTRAIGGYQAQPTEARAILPTAVSAPSLSLPFFDDFEQGLRPEWKVTYGEVLIDGGRLTAPGAYEDKDRAVTLSIGERLTNYAIDFDYQILPNMYHIGFIVGNSIKYQSNEAIPAEWWGYSQGKWGILKQNGMFLGRGGHALIRVQGSNVSLSTGEGTETITFGSGMPGPFVLTLTYRAFIDNFRLYSP